MSRMPFVTKPAELEKEEEYDEILSGLLAEAQALHQRDAAATAEDFVRQVGYRRWMSNFADYWNIPEDEQLDRREVAHIDRFVAEVFEAAVKASGDMRN